MKHLHITLITAVLSLLMLTSACNNDTAAVAIQETPPVELEDTENKSDDPLTDKDEHRNHLHSVKPDSLALTADSVAQDTLAVMPDSLTLRILSIGNSFARDAFSYVPFLLQELVPNLKLDWTIMYYGGRPLKDHWTALQNGKAEYQRDTYSTESAAWLTEKGKALPEELDSLHQWDLIIFQQASGTSPSYSTYQPYLHNLLSEARSKVPEAKIGWLLTPAHPQGSKHMPTATSDEMWQLICDAVGQLTSDERIDVVLPAGTAIQNARLTHLDSLGLFGHMSADGLHLQDGIPCLIEAYTITQTLLNFFHIPQTIALSTLQPTQQWATERHIPEMNGNVLEGTDDDYALSRRIALRTVYNPYSLFTGTP